MLRLHVNKAHQMAQQVKMPAAKPDCLSSILGSHTVREIQSLATGILRTLL